MFDRRQKTEPSQGPYSLRKAWGCEWGEVGSGLRKQDHTSSSLNLLLTSGDWTSRGSGGRDISNTPLRGKGECSTEQRCSGREGARSHTRGAPASTVWNHKNNKSFPKSLNYRRRQMNWSVMWWNAVLCSQMWYHPSLLLWSLDLFPMSRYTWFWAGRWGPMSLFNTHMQKSAAPQLSQEDEH